MAGIFDIFKKSGPVEVHFEGSASVEVDRGTTIIEAAEKAGLEIDSHCGRSCSCSTCEVLIRGGAKNLSKVAPNEEAVLSKKKLSSGYRLSCQAKVEGSVHVEIPEYF
jgi:2Fe-2S ferredoxin